MKGTTILWGQALLVGAVVFAFVWAATEWTAWRLAFQPELGRPWFAPFGLPLYPPPAFFWWWFAYDAYAPEVFVEGAYIAASGAIAAIVVAVAMSVWRAREAKTVTTYGSARWAESREIRHAGLFHAEGVVLGRCACAGRRAGLPPGAARYAAVLGLRSGLRILVISRPFP
jgi:type IV secretion system protein VirD4